jgi:hypothetical protein
MAAARGARGGPRFLPPCSRAQGQPQPGSRELLAGLTPDAGLKIGLPLVALDGLAPIPDRELPAAVVVWLASAVPGQRPGGCSERRFPADWPGSPRPPLSPCHGASAPADARGAVAGQLWRLPVAAGARAGHGAAGALAPRNTGGSSRGWLPLAGAGNLAPGRAGQWHPHSG